MESINRMENTINITRNILVDFDGLLFFVFLFAIFNSQI